MADCVSWLAAVNARVTPHFGSWWTRASCNRAIATSGEHCGEGLSPRGNGWGRHRTTITWKNRVVVLIP